MELQIYKNNDELSVEVAKWMVNYIRETLRTQDRFTLVLSGGGTPQKLNTLLAAEPYKNEIDWSKLHIFWGDERFVPYTDERNNAKMAFDTLLDHVPIPPNQVHRMKTENIIPEVAAGEYESILQQYFPPTVPVRTSFDLVLLGMGDDGHTLSLFPGTHVMHEEFKWATSLFLPQQQMFRVTLTPPVVNRAARIAFLVTGPGKAAALQEVIEGDYNPDKYPSQVIKPVLGEVYWFVDKAAASMLH
ncbi:MAG TPA: 6-phosphogluconolactonase [Chitinophagaceae bacterium]|jgi:6-phosphogluconolactonase|nr:6-phosphogluconolactonase [Chitinophagaceae bacterium]